MRRTASVAGAMIAAPKVCDVSTTAADLRHFFGDDHVHAALVVEGRVLRTVVVRSDLTASTPGATVATELGQLPGRVIHGSEPLDDAKQWMLAAGLRRLAVVDDEGRLLGLLCLNHSRMGFCTERDIQARASELSTVTPAHTD
jgi:CBS domain-containing protein